MLKKLSLRARLTLLSALVMTGAAIILTAVSMFSADHIFVQNLPQDLGMRTILSTTAAEGAPMLSSEASIAQPESDVSYSVQTGEKGEAMDAAVIQISLAKASRQFNLWGLAGLVLVLLLGTGATWLMAGRALGPVRELSNAIEEVGDSNFARRVEMHGRQDEIGRLAHSFNSMMDKVSASFARQKRFSASAAHELKTPLATMQVGLEVLELDAQPSPERMEKTLAVAKTNTERMIHLLDDLMRLSSDETGEMCDTVPLCELFTEIQAELLPQIQANRLTVSIEAEPEAKLTGSRTMLYRALFNLAENAVKYNREGGSITLSAKREDGAAEVRVTDTGIGMPEAELPHIFEPFYRVDRSRSRAVGGSGLGLSLVQDIVEKHGGDIRVESAPGEGTSFILRFPIAR